MKEILFPLFLLFATNCWASQYVSSSDGSGTSTAVSTLATASLSTTSGNTIIVPITGTAGVTVTSVTDTAGNTYLQTTNCYESNNTGSFYVISDIWYSANIIGNAANVVTAHFSGTNQYPAVGQIQYLPTASGSSAFLTCGRATSGGALVTSLSSSNFTPGSTVDFDVAVEAQSGGDTVTVSSPYSLIIAGQSYAHYLTPSATSQSVTFNLTSGAYTIVSVAAFANKSIKNSMTLRGGLIIKGGLNV